MRLLGAPANGDSQTAPVAGEPTEKVTQRVADPNTMDDYKNRLITQENGSRFAGRVWTDKTVFPYSDEKHTIPLDMETDGITGSVDYNADFAHVFSALTSSQLLNEYPPTPLDVVILLDVSTSMTNTSQQEAGQPADALHKVIQHANTLLETILNVKNDPTISSVNRVGVVVYGGGSEVLLPLDHYSKNGGNPFLSVSTDTLSKNTTVYFPKIDANAKKGSTNITKTSDFFRADSTYLQGALYQGMHMLATSEDTVWTNPETGKEMKRKPFLIVLTDGATNNVGATSTGASPHKQVDKIDWWNPIGWASDPDSKAIIPNNGNNNYAYPNDNPVYIHDTVTDNMNAVAPRTLAVLLTAGYMKNWVEDHYTDKLTGFGIGLNIGSYNVDGLQWAQLYGTMDPKEYVIDRDSVTPGNGTEQLKRVYDKLHDYINGSECKLSFVGKNAWLGYILSAEWDFTHPTGTTNDPITGNKKYDITSVDDVYYIDRFLEASTENINSVFDQIWNEIQGAAFIPVSGENDAGVDGSITYQDPLGDYMEIKNQAIKVTPYHTSGDLDSTGQTTYDMAALLFGEMHGLVRAGVYDYQWNDKYMKATDKENAGTKQMKAGWYRGNINVPEDQIKSSIEYSEGIPKESGTAEQAWKDGWVYRLSYGSLTDYVPITDIPSDIEPDKLPDQIKNTVYTVYKFSCSDQDQNLLRRNPVYGPIPDDIQKKWDDYYKANQKYPDNNSIYADTDGVYRLNDIRVWTEDTGDYIDTEGVVAPNTGYDISLYVNIPSSAIPTELATITTSGNSILSYETNLPSDHRGNTEEFNECCRESTPFRLFYTVGLDNDVIIRDSNGKQSGVDFSKISAEYIKEHTVEGQNYVDFISNYYSNTPYSRRNRYI